MKQHFLTYVCVFAALSLAGCKQYAHEAYISSVNGSDENQGTKESPFKTIARANELINPDDTAAFTYYLEGTFDYEDDDWGIGLRLSNNKVIGYGGNAILNYKNKSYGLWMEDDKPITLKNLTIHCPNGGGISIVTTDCYMENCIVEDCTDGGINIDFDSYLYMKDCIVRNNKRQSSGAGIHAENSAMHLVNCQIINNKIETEELGSNGGGIYIRNTSDKNSHGYVIENCVIAGNVAHNTGGGICADIHSFQTNPYTIKLKNTKITGNSAYDGGGIVVYEYVTVETEGVEVNGNTARNIGGGICTIDNPSLSAKGELTGDVVSTGNTPDDRITFTR